MALRSLASGSLFAESIGKSPPAVLALHGWGRRGSDFSNSLVAFGALAVDLPGFGATPAPGEVWGARDYAENLLPVLDEFAQPPVLVGHSFGGRIAICLAAAYPDRVGPVLITGAPLLRISSPRRPRLDYRLARKLNNWNVVSDATIERMRRSRGSADYRAATGVMRDVLVRVVNEEYREELARQTKPVKLIWGENDAEVPVEVARQSAQIVTGAGGIADVQVISGVGHLLPTQAPQALAAAVGRFV